MIKRGLAVFCCMLMVSACASPRPLPDRAKPPEDGLKPWQRPYTVMGRRYEPLMSHQGFVQQGIASWYGSDFHGRNTSNGEKYDMYAMTAAHKTLPLGVYVRVSNRRNGRTVVVRVNDRGPFVRDRIIDLSYSAARTLGMDDVGTAPVLVEALGYRLPGSESYRPVENYDTGSYTVQIGSFRERRNAQRLSGRMRELHGFSEIRVAVVRGITFYRVYAGRYTSLTSAKAAEQDFSEHGYPGSFTVARE